MIIDDHTKKRGVAIRFTFIAMISLWKLMISLWNALWQLISHLMRWSHYASWWSHYETRWEAIHLTFNAIISLWKFMISLWQSMISLGNALWQFISHLLEWSHYESWWSHYETRCGNSFHIPYDDLTMKVDDLINDIMKHTVTIHFTFIPLAQRSIALAQRSLALWRSVHYPFDAALNSSLAQRSIRQ